MNLKLLFCLAAGLTVLPAPAARSQALQTDSVLAQARLSATAVYLEAVGLESQIYNGTEYINYDMPHITGHQFFLTNKEMPAEIRYAGAGYSQVPLLYDLHRDQLVLTHPTSALKLKLINDKVTSFTLGGHAFIRLHKDSLAAGPGKTGFYQVLVNGKVQALAKRYKDLQEAATREGMTGEFRDINRYFLLQDHTLIPVKSKGDVYKALPERRKELQQYARDQKLKFGRNREADLVAIIRHYNGLTATP
jgi:hypothetical protein